MRIVLKDGFVVTDEIIKCNIIIENGIISGVSNETPQDSEIIDCAGKYILPGLIDMHAHFREPGFEYKEDIASGAAAAAYGGFTTVCCMANTSPVLDNGTAVSWVKQKGKDAGFADVIPFGCVTKGMRGEELTEMGDLLVNGACGFSDDGSPVLSSEVMRRALEYSSYFGSFLSVHEEDIVLTNDGVVHEGRISTEYGFKGIPAESETVMLARDIQLVRLAGITGGRVHFCHLSSRHSVELVRRAKEDGLNVTAEVTHNHLYFTEELCSSFDTNSKINPPLRSESDRDALIEGVNSGVIDCIVTDHAPHHKDDKFKEYDYAAFGVTGLQTLIPATMELIRDKKLNWVNFAKSASGNPARILGLNTKGALKRGFDADITVIDPDIEYIFDPSVNKSKSFNTPFMNKKLRGMAVCVLKNGRLLF